MSKSLSAQNEPTTPESLTVPLPVTTVPYKDMAADAQNEYIETLTMSVNDYCDLMGC